MEIKRHVQIESNREKMRKASLCQESNQIITIKSKNILLKDVGRDDNTKTRGNKCSIFAAT